jgi:hypothetical protein
MAGDTTLASTLCTVAGQRAVAQVLVVRSVVALQRAEGRASRRVGIVARLGRQTSEARALGRVLLAAEVALVCVAGDANSF